MRITSLLSKLPDQLAFMGPSRHQLLIVSAGWVVVAVCEAAAYTLLALTVAGSQPIIAVLLSAAFAVVVTVIVTRSGFITGGRLAGNMYTSLGDALDRAKLSSFSEAFRTQVSVLAGQGIPGMMSIPAHQLQLLLHAPLLPLLLMVGIALIGGLYITLMAVVLLSLSLAMQFYAQGVLKSVDRHRHQAELSAAQSMREFIDHLDLLRTATGKNKSIDRVASKWVMQEQALSDTNKGAAIASFWSSLSAALPLVGLAGYALFWESLSGGELLALIILIGRAAAPLEELAVIGTRINDLQAAINSYEQVIRTPVLDDPAPDQAEVPKGNHIRVEGLTQPPALTEVSLEIPEGSTFLIRGPSGSGKSTLVELLMRFDDPQCGTICIGGVGLEHMGYAEIVNRFAYVGQEPILFTGSMADNIRLGRPDASDADIEKAARQALLGPLIDRSELGIHLAVGHNGTLLSGGERQRIAIARGLIKNVPLLILDEATSALDSVTEQGIAQVIRKLPQTVIIVTHGTPSIWSPDQVIEFAKSENLGYNA